VLDEVSSKDLKSYNDIENGDASHPGNRLTQGEGRGWSARRAEASGA
jgi:hypothetical protein